MLAMSPPRYSLRMLIAGITLVALLLGCVFGGWADSCLIALSLEPSETKVYEQTIEVSSGRWERLVRCYTIDPAEFVLEIVDINGKRREIVVDGNGTPFVGLRWLQMRIVIQNGELGIRDAISGKEIVHKIPTRNGSWPEKLDGDSESSGMRGIVFDIAPGVWLYTVHTDASRAMSIE